MGRKAGNLAVIVENFRLNRIESMIMGKLLEEKKKKLLSREWRGKTYFLG